MFWTHVFWSRAPILRRPCWLAFIDACNECVRIVYWLWSSATKTDQNFACTNQDCVYWIICSRLGNSAFWYIWIDYWYIRIYYWYIYYWYIWIYTCIIHINHKCTRCTSLVRCFRIFVIMTQYACAKREF